MCDHVETDIQIVWLEITWTSACIRTPTPTEPAPWATQQGGDGDG